MICNVHNQTNGYNGFGFRVVDLKFKPIMVVDADGIIARTFQSLEVERVKRKQFLYPSNASQRIDSFLVLLHNLWLKPILLVFGSAIVVQFL
mgnify:CR=1 FL=1